MKAKTLVLGGNGKTGRRVIERLQNLNLSWRAASRSTFPQFDWENSENWQEALANIEQVYITFQPDLSIPDAVDRIASFVKHAQLARVKKLILLSGRGEAGAQKCENIVMQSGLDWTVIRASWFTQNFSESFFLESIQAGNLLIPRVKALEPFIDADDIADVVTEVLINEGHSQKIYDLTGPDLLSFKMITDLFSACLRREVILNEVSGEEYVTILKSYGVPDDFVWLIDHLFTEVLDGRNESLTDDVENILGRKPASFENYINKTIPSGIWGQ